MNFDEIKLKFGNELSSPAVNPRTRRYSKELKAAVLSAMKSHEASIYEVSKNLGFSATALYHWISKDSIARQEQNEDVFVPAKLVPTKQVSFRAQDFKGMRSLIIHMPSGEKIELSY